MIRPSRDHVFMEIAKMMAMRGNCLRGQVGAIITSGANRIISSGYNGPVIPDSDCYKLQCKLDEKCQHAVHAEANAIMAAANYGIKLFMGTIYCTHAPCENCAKLIFQSGLAKVVYEKNYTDDFGIRLLYRLGVTVVQFPYEQIKDNNKEGGSRGLDTPLSDYTNGLF
jgi:dCMP deaminase